MCGDLDSLELGDTVEYTLAKGKGNKVSAEKVTKVAPGASALLSNCKRSTRDLKKKVALVTLPPSSLLQSTPLVMM